MTTQIMFKIDPKTKKAIQKRAKEEGMGLSDVFQHLGRSYAKRQLDIGVMIAEDSWDDYTEETKINFQKGLADIRAKRFSRVR